MQEMRLQKYLAKAGVASRRKSEEIISQGRVSVNNKVVTEMGIKVSDNDTIKVDGKVVGIDEEKVYILLNKPTGYVTTSKDQFSRPTVIDLVENIDERVYPVGRLDYDTSGLIILTNDGDFTYKLTHPSHEIDKTYIAKIKGTPHKSDLYNFRSGLKIDNYTTSPAKIKIIRTDNKTSFVEIVIHEGKNRQVRKMCEKIGHPVIELKRITVGNLSLGDLKEGEWRYLTPEEVNTLC